MLFTSWAFVPFFAGVLLALRVAPSRTARQWVLLVASCIFYAHWEPWYLLLLATPSLIDYVCAIRIEDAGGARVRKRWLVFSLVSNLGLLAYFKYADFFVQSVSGLLGVRAERLDVLLPVGISFFTFKTLSYTIDVYRREIPAERGLWRYAMFVTYFPELVAGPIVRASVFLPQMGRSLRPSWKRAAVGAQLVLLGLTKKLVVADRLAVLVDAVFAAPHAYDGFTVACAVVAYSLQIYCDFSGYSDMAIGISRIIGFDLPENFNLPYLSTSIAEFWRRWHITLSTWLRDYLYIPLGGNRRGPLRTQVNLILTMLLGGLWHGAAWTFVFWGLLHGVGLAVHRAWAARVPAGSGRARTVAAWAATYAFVCMGWVFFRAPDFGSAFVILGKLVGVGGEGIRFFYLPFFLLLPLVVVAHWIGHQAERMGCVPGPRPRRIPAPAWAARWFAGAGVPFAVRPHPAAGIYVLLPLPGFVGGFLLMAWLLLVWLFASVETNPFIYFQF